MGKRTANPSDYVIRAHRGQVNAYLMRDMAAPVEGLAAIVYTRDAYLSDPDVKSDQTESTRVAEYGYTHVVVAVLASAGPKSPLTSDRFVKNLAGGNKEALEWSADEIRAKAAEIASYYSEWSVVAD